MFTDEDRALLKQATIQRELIQGPDGTVWCCFDRIVRYAIPDPANLTTIQTNWRNRGFGDVPIVKKNAAALDAYGTPVYATPPKAAVDAPLGAIDYAALAKAVNDDAARRLAQ